MEGGEAVEIESAPVEIELTPTGPRGHANAPAPTTSADDLPERPTPGRSPADRTVFSRRVIVALAGVGVIAFVAGWLVGRSAGSGDAERSPVATDRAMEITPSIIVGTVPAPTADRRSATAVSRTESTVIDVDQRFDEATYDVVGITRSGDLVEVDLAEGELATRSDVGTSGMGGPSALWAGDGWVVVPDWNTETSLLIEDGEAPVRLPIGPPWQVFPSETPGEFWVLDQNLRQGLAGDAQRVDRHAEPIGVPVSLDEAPLYSDPTGGLVVQVTEAAYRVDGNQATKIVDGHLMALDEQRAIARTCSKRAVALDGHTLFERSPCAYISVDRTTGAITTLPIDANYSYLPNYWSGTDATRIAPDGRTIAVAWSEPAAGGTLGVIDLDSGELTILSDVNEGLVRWTPDARFALYLEAGVPMAHELETGESFVISDDLPRLNAIALRPASRG